MIPENDNSPQEAASLHPIVNRRSFEEWIGGPPYERDLYRWPMDETKHAWPGQYKDIAVQLAWEAWCGAANESSSATGREQPKRMNTSETTSALLGFGDALRIARGCHDYSGEHHTDGHYDAYHRGIQTVINALEAAEKAGLSDTQAAVVWCIGGKNPNDQAQTPRANEA